MPRSLVHLMLSLLLLFTQQMALLHVTSHVAKARTTNVVQTAEHLPSHGHGKPPLLDFCAKCLDSAQLAFSAPAPAHVFELLMLAYGAPVVRRSAGIDLHTVHAFQPRGPPLAG